MLTVLCLMQCAACTSVNIPCAGSEPCFTSPGPSRSPPPPPPLALALLPFGNVRGVEREKSNEYLGVPYATRPKRFALSAPFGSDGKHPGFESGTFDAASKFGNVCPQSALDIENHPLQHNPDGMYVCSVQRYGCCSVSTA